MCDNDNLGTCGLCGRDPQKLETEISDLGFRIIKLTNLHQEQAAEIERLRAVVHECPKCGEMCKECECQEAVIAGQGASRMVTCQADSS